MELLEREEFLISLRTQFEKAAEGEGHCVFVSGEAGIGKTSLIKAFCREKKNEANIYTGTCDALFTPRPLAPLYDIAWQIRKDMWENSKTIEDRAGLFAKFGYELSNPEKQTLLIFEDIHWADEATLDFIKFFSRRITHTSCLFILTYRDNEIHSRHPLRNVLGDLAPDSFTRLHLVPLSRPSVEKMAKEKGYRGEDVHNVYSVSGGNPFYVNEILASYSQGVPENIKDSILSVYNRLDEKTKYFWEILSVLPTGLETGYLEKMDPQYEVALGNCIDSQILVPSQGQLWFKHELYRRTIEESLSPLKRLALHKKILDLFQQGFEENGQIERILHHAKNANEHDLVVHYAPLAAVQAAAVGSHMEASKLYLSAIEYYQGNDPDTLLRFYEPYAYECYLTNQIKEAIIYQGKALAIWRGKNDIEKVGNSLRFLSRLWWYDGNQKHAEQLGREAIEVLEHEPASRVKAMAYSNMSQLGMLADRIDECIHWGDKASAMALELNDEEILSHALNNMGAAQAKYQRTFKKGMELLEQSLALALKNSYHEHAARAYTNLVSAPLMVKEYGTVRKYLQEGIQYCEERHLDSWTKYMLSCEARLNLETGHWDKACEIAGHLLENENQSAVIKIGALIVLSTIKMRRGDADVLPLLYEAKERAMVAMEMQRIAPALAGLLEYEWITGNRHIEPEILEKVLKLAGQSDNILRNSELDFWLFKARGQHIPLPEVYEGYNMQDKKSRAEAAALWDRLGCPYEHALILFEGTEDDKRKAISIIHELGGNAVYEKLKKEMRDSGIKKIPRGSHESTRSNAAGLTRRELDILELLKENMQNKEIASSLFISAKTVDHHITSILFKLDVNSRTKAVQAAVQLGIIK